MHQEDVGLVHEIAHAAAKEEIAKVLAELKLKPVVKTETPKPVEVDIDGIVKLVLDKIKLSTPVVAAETPSKKVK